MKKICTIALIGLLATLSRGEDLGPITNYYISIQFKDGTMGGVAIPWLLDKRNPNYCQKVAIGLQVGNTNDVWFISTDTLPIVATNQSGHSYILPRRKNLNRKDN